MRRRTFTSFLLLAACGAGPGEEAAAQPTGRCAHCGMLVAGDWLACGATQADGGPVVFDTPKCLFGYLASAAGAGASEAWVTEYYGRTRQPVDRVVYVDGSDVSGPMGADLVPIAPRERAEEFVRDHGGTILDLAAARVRALQLFRHG
jgi:nitrous oxide reductase accessory protein NosL